MLVHEHHIIPVTVIINLHLCDDNDDDDSNKKIKKKFSSSLSTIHIYWNKMKDPCNFNIIFFLIYSAINSTKLIILQTLVLQSFWTKTGVTAPVQKYRLCKSSFCKQVVYNPIKLILKHPVVFIGFWSMVHKLCLTEHKPNFELNSLSFANSLCTMIFQHSCKDTKMACPRS